MSVRPPPPPSNILTPPSSSSSSQQQQQQQQQPSPSSPLGPRTITPQLIEYINRASKDNGDTLDFSRLQLEDVGEDALEALAKGRNGHKGVKRLALSHNALTSLSSSFLLLTRLRYLNLKGNDLREWPPVLASLQTLEILDISRNKIRKLPEKGGRLTKLRVLSLSQNRIRVLPGWMVDSEELKVFKIDHNPLEWPPKHLTTRTSNMSEAEEKAWIGAMRACLREHPNGPPVHLASSEPSTSPIKQHQSQTPLPTSTSVGSTSSSIFATPPHKTEPAAQQQASASTHRRAHSRSDSRSQSISNRQITIPPSPSVSSTTTPHNNANNADIPAGRPQKPAHARSASSISRPPSPPMTEASSSRTPFNSNHPYPHLPEPQPRPTGSYPSPSPSPIEPSSGNGASSDLPSPSTADPLSPNDHTPTTATHSHSSHHLDSYHEPQAPSPSIPAVARAPSPASFSIARPPRQPLAQPPASRPPTVLSNACRHSRNASFNAQPQRLSQLLGAKKSLPDLRLPHAQIISERRHVGDVRVVSVATGGVGVASGAGWAGGEAERVVNRGMGGGRMNRKASDDALSIRSNSRPFPSNRTLLQGLENASPSNPLNNHNNIPSSTTSTDGPHSLYFQRLSTLHPSPVPPSTVLPPPLLSFIHSTRSLLFALSQIRTSLSSHLLLSPHHLHLSTNVLQKVLQPAGIYVERLVDALDRFDSVSRRKTGGVEGGVVRGVVEASRDAVGVFGKVVAVLSIQLKVSGSSSSTGGKEKEGVSEELRFTRTLLLMLYGAMSEVSIAWNAMQPLLKEIAPLLSASSSANTPTSRSFSQPHHPSSSSASPSGPSTPGPSRPHHILSNASTSLNGAAIRTPISPIPERAESQSPSSSMANSPVFNRSLSASQPFSSLISSASNGSLSGMAQAAMAGVGGGGGGSGSKKNGKEEGSASTPMPASTPTPGPPSQAARSKSRRHAGSFSTKDVEFGAKMAPTSTDPTPPTKSTSSAPSSAAPALRSALRNPFASSSSPSSTAPSASSSPQTHNVPLHNNASAASYETSPFTVSEPFSKPRTNGTNPSINPSPLQIPSSNPSSSRSPSSSDVSPNGGRPSSSQTTTLSRPTHSSRSSVSSMGEQSSSSVPTSPPDDQQLSSSSSHPQQQQQQQQQPAGAATTTTSSYASSNVRNGRYGLSNYGRSGSAAGLAAPETPQAAERPSMTAGGGGGGGSEAASKVMDDGLAQILEEAVQAALAVYPSIEEDVTAFLQFVANTHANSLSESTTTTLRSPPLPTKRTAELLSLLPSSIAHAQILQSILSSRLSSSSHQPQLQQPRSTSPPSPSPATPTLAEASQTFLSQLTTLAGLARLATLEDRIEFRRSVKVGLGKLTRLGMDCGTLMHVSSLRGVTRPGTSLSVHQQQQQHGQQGEEAGVASGRTSSVGMRSAMRPLALGTGAAVVGGSRTRTATFGMVGGRPPLGTHTSSYASTVRG